jgi:1,4-alpha-glucan branching enzyme
LAQTVDANRDMGVIANAIQYNVRYGGVAGFSRVAFLESHDVVGGLNGGVRLPAAIDPATPDSYWARKRSTLGAVVTFTAPGVPLLFQGQEMLENQPFSSSVPVDWTKTNTYRQIVLLYRDLISARRNLRGYTPGLQGGQCALLQRDDANKLVAFSRWDVAAPDQCAVVVANFSSATLSNYHLPFPTPGTWYVHFNSDSTYYGSDFGNGGSLLVTAGGNPVAANLAIGPYSALIQSLTPDRPPSLGIKLADGALALSWPVWYFGWVLESSPSASATSTWLPVSGFNYQTNATTVSASASLPSASSFFRLRPPLR